MSTDSRPATTLRSRFREETAAAILNAAEHVIAEDGLHGARMDRIAAAAGVSVGTLYNHFEDRAELVDALRASRAGYLRDLLAGSMAEVEAASPREQVLALFRAMVAHARAHGRFFAALMAEHHGPSQLRPPAHARAELTRHAGQLVARGLAAGHFRPVAPELATEALVALARVVLVRAIEGTADAATLDGLAELFLRGVAA